MDTSNDKKIIENRSQVRTVYIAYIWHGFFLALTMSMIDLNTVFPSLISSFTSSKTLFGTLYAVMLGGPLVFNLIFSHYLASTVYKKKYLLLGIFMRAFAFLGMSLTTFFLGVSYPMLAIAVFFVWVLIFSVSAGFAGIAYADLMGKSLESKKRTQLYAAKQFFASAASFAGGLIITGILKPGVFSFPNNYALTLAIGFFGLLIASIGFFFIKEPASPHMAARGKLLDYIRSVPSAVKADRALLRFIIVENMASFSVMVLPFYIIYARESFDLDESFVGKFLLVQVTGTILSNLVWGYISRRSQSRVIIQVCTFTGAVIPLIALFAARVSPMVYGAVFFLLGFIVSGRLIGFEAALLDIAPPDKRTHYLGIRGTLNISIIVLPILGSIFIRLLGYEITFILVSLIMFTASWLSRKYPNCPRGVSSDMNSQS
ncbi:MAG: MFS transporter [Clostridiaceae bacterium]|nr:MFS transporter [Clostridiaceae bacterium]